MRVILARFHGRALAALLALVRGHAESNNYPSLLPLLSTSVVESTTGATTADNKLTFSFAIPGSRGGRTRRTGEMIIFDEGEWREERSGVILSGMSRRL